MLLEIKNLGLRGSPLQPFSTELALIMRITCEARKPGGIIMCVFIQHITTKQYLTREGTWTTELKQAMKFANVLQAIDHCWGHRVFDVRLFLKTDQLNLEMSLDVFKRADTRTEGRW